MPTDGNAKAQRKLATILAADIAGYSALMGADEEATVRDLKAHQSVILPLIKDHGGRIIDTAGDGHDEIVGKIDINLEHQAAAWHGARVP